jgi:hypothetical protein
MPNDEPFAGRYIGRPGPRPGREEDLSPVEKKRFLGSKEAYELILYPDELFLHNSTTKGNWRRSGDRIRFEPRLFQGKSFEQQREECENLGRQFRFAFVYDPFELEIHDQRLVEVGTGVIATVYERS